MKSRDVFVLLLLAAIWGSSYLFIRLSVTHFGPLGVAALRAGGAALLLLPLVIWQGDGRALIVHWKTISLVGVTNCTLPFALFSFAALTLNAGLSSVFSATAPLFAALFGWLWLADKLSLVQLGGLGLGFAGVALTASDTLHFESGIRTQTTAVAACLLAAGCYGLSVTIAKRYLQGVSPLAVAAGSQIVSALLLAVPAVIFWPTTPPSLSAWSALGALAVICTTFAYVLFFRLIGRIGTTRTMTVTFIIPVFGLFWGAMFLHETFSWRTAFGCAVIFLGTAFTHGLLTLGRVKTLIPALVTRAQ